MSTGDIVRMVNQIAAFFAPYPEEEAVEGVRDHLVKFWPVTMRDELAALAQRADAANLHPLALQAARRLVVPDTSND